MRMRKKKHLEDRLADVSGLYSNLWVDTVRFDADEAPKYLDFAAIFGKGAPYVRLYFDALHSFYRDPAKHPLGCFANVASKVIPDEFVFGYGLDLFEKYRDLPYVAVVSPEYLKQIGK